MNYFEKCELLNSSPVVLARNFLRTVLKSFSKKFY